MALKSYVTLKCNCSNKKNIVTIPSHFENKFTRSRTGSKNFQRIVLDYVFMAYFIKPQSQVVERNHEVTTVPRINSETIPPLPIINVVFKYLRQFTGTSFGVPALPIYCYIEQVEGPDFFLKSRLFQSFRKFFQELSWSQ